MKAGLLNPVLKKFTTAPITVASEETVHQGGTVGMTFASEATISPTKCGEVLMQAWRFVVLIAAVGNMHCHHQGRCEASRADGDLERALAQTDGFLHEPG